MKIVMIGDSIVGNAADGQGGLAKALAPHIDLHAVGVGGSTVANWLHASGYDGPGRGYVMGRWGSGSRMAPLTHEECHRAYLPSLMEIESGAWWLNFGTNDRNSGRPAKMWVDQAMAMLEIVPAERVVWTMGNDIPHHRAWRQDALPALQSLANKRWPGRVLVIGGKSRAYRRGQVHPRVSSHTAWLKSNLERIETHLTEIERRVALQKALKFLAAIFWAIGGFR